VIRYIYEGTHKIGAARGLQAGAHGSAQARCFVSSRA
jgi:hypothetical protein